MALPGLRTGPGPVEHFGIRCFFPSDYEMYGNLYDMESCDRKTAWVWTSVFVKRLGDFEGMFAMAVVPTEVLHPAARNAELDEMRTRSLLVYTRTAYESYTSETNLVCRCGRECTTASNMPVSAWLSGIRVGLISFPSCSPPGTACFRRAYERLRLHERKTHQTALISEASFARGCLVSTFDRKADFRQCSRCKAAIYCSLECHRRNWKARKQLCEPFVPRRRGTSP
ncbi:hypothetical protein DFJ74DRAFT_706007 [Hyaloraphidium curvatum]|nr:hypothetical protein DFJ74DRAFT_706007 [Hyaloraphidium curvatum]